MFVRATVTFGATLVGIDFSGQPRAVAANASNCIMDLHDETVINVVALLKEPVGASRKYDLQLAGFPLDEEALAENVEGEVKLTRLADEILLDVRARGTVELECVRCLRHYNQPFWTRFSAAFLPTVDVRTGMDLTTIEDDERFTIDERHQIDIREPLRQEILVALPMRTICGDECPGPDVPRETIEEIDERLAALAKLLDDDADRMTTAS